MGEAFRRCHRERLQAVSGAAANPVENQFYNAFDQEPLEPEPARDPNALPREPDAF